MPPIINEESKKRNCYCSLWIHDPEHLEQQGIQHGYC